MADDGDWDPFADPAGETEVPGGRQAVSAAPSAGSGAAPLGADALGADAPPGAVELDLLQPWEVERLDAGTRQRAEADRRDAEARAPAARRPLVVLPSAAELERELAAAGLADPLRAAPELVDRAFAGDAAAVGRLLADGADPNTVVLREERLKGSDGCCSCTITSEEYTPLIAACMSLHSEVADVLLQHAAIDVNVVCQGVNEEFGPYKHFTALDMARLVKADAVRRRLEGLGARPAADLPTPPWPRPPASAAGGDACGPPGGPGGGAARGGAARRDAPLPSAASPGPGVPAAAAEATAQLLSELRAARGCPPSERLRLFRQLMLAWHPDKRPAEEADVATAVCQWLNGPGRCFLE